METSPLALLNFKKGLLSGKKIVLGVTGSIAAYKAAELASLLLKEGAEVNVVMTKEAKKFITPLTFQALTSKQVISSIFPPSPGLEHIALAKEADLFIIAPATAHTIAKLSCGLADDMVSMIALSTKAPIIIAPAMEEAMWENKATQENIERLKGRGFFIIGPAYGRLASGKEGWGRMEEVGRILEAAKYVLGMKGDLSGRKLVITAGGTQEPLDSVKILTNRSSGLMGYSIAQAARDRGASVTLISAPTYLPEPFGVKVIKVITAEEMKETVKKEVMDADALIMAAAVADYRPKKRWEGKIKRVSPLLTLELERTPDILLETRGDFLRVGFSLESENMIENATRKLKEKDLDLIVANDINSIGAESAQVVVIDREGRVESFPPLPKYEIASRLLNKIVQCWKERDEEGAI